MSENEYFCDPEWTDDDRAAEDILKRGMGLSDTERYDEAIVAFTEVLKLATNFHLQDEAHSRRATCYKLLGKHEEAIADLNWLIEEDSPSDFHFWRRAMSNMELGNYSDAADDYGEAFALGGSLPHLFLRGKALLEIPKADEAIDVYQHLIAENYGDSLGAQMAIYIWLGKAYMLNEQYDEALTAFTKTLEFNPSLMATDGNLYMGLTLEKLDRDEEALVRFKKMHSYRIDHPDIERIKKLVKKERGHLF